MEVRPSVCPSISRRNRQRDKNGKKYHGMWVGDGVIVEDSFRVRGEGKGETKKMLLCGAHGLVD